LIRDTRVSDWDDTGSGDFGKKRRGKEYSSFTHYVHGLGFHINNAPKQIWCIFGFENRVCMEINPDHLHLGAKTTQSYLLPESQVISIT
jgi:hypothetical protein